MFRGCAVLHGARRTRPLPKATHCLLFNQHKAPFLLNYLLRTHSQKTLCFLHKIWRPYVPSVLHNLLHDVLLTVIVYFLFFIKLEMLQGGSWHKPVLDSHNITTLREKYSSFMTFTPSLKHKYLTWSCHFLFINRSTKQLNKWIVMVVIMLPVALTFII